MPADRCSAFACLALGSLFLAGACVDLTAPWDQRTAGGGQGGDNLDAAISTVVDTPGTGGADGTTVGGAGGATTGTAGGATTGTTGGTTMGGATTGGTGAVNTGGASSAGAGGEGGARAGGAGGGRTGGAGGSPTGGATATGGSTRPGDGAVPPDLRPASEGAARAEVAPPPDAAIDAPGVPDAVAVPDVAQIPDGAQVPDVPADTPTATPGLVLYYSCEQATGAAGTTLPDISGNGNNGALVGAVSIGPGKVGNALVFTPTNNADAAASGGYVTMPPALLSTSPDMTIATWFKINTNPGFQRIFDIGTSSAISSMYLTPNGNSGYLQFTFRSGSTSREDIIDGTAKTMSTGVWEHVAVVLDASGGRLYLNGVQVGSNTTMKMRPPALGNTPNDWIGRSEYSNPYFDGAIDEFRIYSRALSAAEVLALYNGH